MAVIAAGVLAAALSVAPLSCGISRGCGEPKSIRVVRVAPGDSAWSLTMELNEDLDCAKQDAVDQTLRINNHRSPQAGLPYRVPTW